MRDMRSFLKKSPYGKLQSITGMYWKLKTALFYKAFLGSMGRNCIIRRPVLLAHPEYIHLGDSVHIRDGARIEAIPHSRQRVPNLSIGNNVNIEQNVHIVCQSSIRIGNNVSITGNCAIVDTTHPYQDVNAPSKIGERILDEPSVVEIGDGTFIGYGSIILPNVYIGKHCVIGAHSCVTKDIPDYSVASGNPATIKQRYHPESQSWNKVCQNAGTQ